MVQASEVGSSQVQSPSGRSGFVRYGPASNSYIAMGGRESNTAMIFAGMEFA
jgi:hypothetical protein